MWKTEEAFAASQKWSSVGSESGKMITPHGRGSIYGPIEYRNGHQDAIAKDELGMVVSATLEGWSSRRSCHHDAHAGDAHAVTEPLLF